MLHMENGKEFWTYVASLFLFGTNGVVAAHIIGMGSTQIVMFRTLLGALVLTAVFLLLGRRFTLFENPRHAAMLILSGVSMGVSWMFQYEAYSEIGIGATSLIYCCGPALLTGLAPFVFGEHMSPNRVLGFLLVMCGAVVMSIDGLGYEGSVWGYACAFLTAGAYVCMVVFNKKAPSVKGLENPVVQLIVAFVTVFVFILLKGDMPSEILSTDILPLLVLGIVNTGFGCLLYFTSLAGIEAQTVAICDYLEPASAVLFAVILLGETVGVVESVGMVLIASGVLLGYRNRRLPQPFRGRT